MFFFPALSTISTGVTKKQGRVGATSYPMIFIPFASKHIDGRLGNHLVELHKKFASFDEPSESLSDSSSSSMSEDDKDANLKDESDIEEKEHAVEKDDSNNSKSKKGTIDMKSEDENIVDTTVINTKWLRECYRKRIKFFWPQLGEWFYGTIGRFNQKTMTVMVHYEDKSRAKHNLCTEKFYFAPQVIAEKEMKRGRSKKISTRKGKRKITR